MVSIKVSGCFCIFLSLEAAEVSENLKSSTALEKELTGLCVSCEVGVNFDVHL